MQEILRFSIVNLDKPSGPTSFQVSQHVKNCLNLNKTSHFGTLDPQVTGVLPVALGRACRLSEYFMHKNKEYVGIMRLHENVPEEKLKKEISKFIGKIKQLPPVRSRVKRAVREREIKFFEILEINDKDILFKTEVQAGTYIRKLIHDLGENIGGAHMLELRRTKAGIFSEQDKNFVSLYDFEKAVQEYKKGNENELRRILISAEIALEKIMPKAEVSENSVKQLLTGKPLMKKDLSKLPNEEIFSVFHKEKLLVVYRK